jgi:DNA-binding transcriptional LysR family regulator
MGGWLMDLREMQSLVLLHRTHSILQTAEVLNLTPGAVHKHLKTLEQALGARLYEKQEGTLRLTREGEIVLPFFEQSIENRAAAVQALADWRHGPRGVVRVGVGPSFSSTMLPAILRKFRAREKKVEVYVETGNGDHLSEGLRGGTLDLIFDPIEEGQEAPEVRVAAAWRAEVGLVSALPEVGVNVKMAKLRGVPFILFQKGSRMDRLVQRHFERIGFTPNVVMRSDSSEAIKAMVKGRLGVAMLFLWNANQESQAKSLHAVHTDAPVLTARMGLLQRKSPYTNQAVTSFIETAKGMNWRNLHPES